jgi:4-carboxymuconolactone decarboxylase
MVDELHETATVTPGLWEAMEREWDAEQLVELLALAGQYHLVSFVANAAGVEHEDFAARFPPAPGA